MAFEIDEFLAWKTSQCNPSLPASLVMNGDMTPKAWRTTLQNELRRILGGFNENPIPLAITEIREDKLEGVTRRFFSYQSQEGLTIPAYYLVPSHPLPGKPAIVAITGHGFGAADIVGIDVNGKDYPNVQSSGYQKQFALTLAQMGFYVIAPEMIGYGELRLAEDKQKGSEVFSCYRLGTNLLMCGETIAQLRVQECFRALEVLEAFGDSNKERIGCMGISGGGTVCALFTALEERIRACVISGYANEFKTAVMTVPGHCVDNFFPGILPFAELPDLLSLIAPRPMLWESAKEDPIFPIEGALRAARDVEKYYRYLGAAECFQQDVFTGEHEISGKQSYDFLRHYLAEV